MYHGIGRALGMDIPKDGDAENPGENLAHCIREGLAPIHEYDFIHVNTKAPYAAAHAKNPCLKQSVIEALDGASAG